MKYTSIYISSFFLICILCSGFLRAQTSSQNPNVIFFSTDDLNTWINPLGYSQAKTPNLDRLAKMGITFTNAHAPGVYCAPSRSAIFSGLHASSTGCYTDEIYFYDHPGIVSLQSAFSQAGYKAYGAGKTYHHRAGSIDMRGWEEYFARTQEIKDVGYETGYYGSDVPLPDPYPYSPYYTKTDNVITGGGFLEWGPIATEKAEQIPDAARTNWVCDLLKQEHSDPFFIALGLYSPHFPNYAPQEFFDMYDRDQIIVPDLKEDDLDDLPEYIRKKMTNRLKIQQTLEDLDAVKDAVMGYLAAVSFADAMLGRVLDALEASAYKDNTLIIFWSDQGYHHGEKGQWGKHTLWEETSHVPLLIAGNGLPENQKVNTTVSLIDLYPTLIEMCKLPQQHKMDGVSLASVLNDPSSATDRNVLMPYMERGGYTVINSSWRYIQYHDGSEELYNLQDDPNEYINLASDQYYRDTINEMKKTAPAEFHKSATPRTSLKLVIEEGSYHWESKDGSTPAETINASITFTDPASENGISVLNNNDPNDEAYTEQQTKEDKDCRYIPPNNYAYFQVNDDLFDPNHDNVTFTIQYLDDSNGTFELQYNSKESENSSVVVSKTNTQTWVNKTIMLADASLNNRLRNNSDFRISGDVYLRSVSISRPKSSDVSIVFADKIYENGIEFVIGTDPNRETYTEKATIGDHECRHIPYTDKNKYGYFKVDDSVILKEDNELTFEITYFDEGTSPLRLQYNSINSRYEKTEITKTDTKTWLTRSFTVKDAAFENSQNNNSDFRIVSDNYIRRVAIKKASTQTTVKPPLKKEGLDVNIWLNQGLLNVSLPQGIEQARLEVYSLLGQLLFQTEMNQSQESFLLDGSSDLYIVVIKTENTMVSKKIYVSEH